MSTDFSYDNSTIVSSGPFKSKNRNVPLNARYRVETYADIANIPVPAVGELVFVLSDENNNNQQNIYVIKSLKPSTLGIADSLVDEVVPLKTFLGTDDINLSDYVTEDELNNKGYATTTEVDNKLIEYVSKEYIDTTIEGTKEYADNAINDALDGHVFKFLTQSEYDELSDEEKNDPFTEYHITDSIDSTTVTEEYVENSIKTALDNKTIKVLTKTQWESLSVKDNNTIYIVME